MGVTDVKALKVVCLKSTLMALKALLYESLKALLSEGLQALLLRLFKALYCFRLTQGFVILVFRIT